jgi:hypothetical protein
MTRKPNAQFRDSTATISWDVILLSTKLGHHVRAEAAVEAGAGAEASVVVAAVDEEAVAAAVAAEAVAETAAIEEAVAATVAGKRNSIEIEL